MSYFKRVAEQMDGDVLFNLGTGASASVAAYSLRVAVLLAIVAAVIALSVDGTSVKDGLAILLFSSTGVVLTYVLLYLEASDALDRAHKMQILANKLKSLADGTRKTLSQSEVDEALDSKFAPWRYGVDWLSNLCFLVVLALFIRYIVVAYV